MSLLTTAGRAALGAAWSSGTYKAMLLRPSYVPDVADGAVSALTAYEITGTGYTGGYGGSGRKTLASKTVTAVPASDEVRYDAADLTWTALDAGVVGWVAVIAEAGGSDATSTVLAVLSVPATLTDGSDFPVEWPATGLWVG